MKRRILNLAFLIICFLCFCISTFSQTPSKNKMVVTRYFEEIINKQRPELLTEVFSQDYFFHSLEDGSENRGIKQLQDFLPYFFKAFPDIHYSIDQIIAEKDNVVVQATVTGTQKGEFWSYPTSNNKIKVSEVFFFTLKDNKIIENRRMIDLFHLDKQLTGIK
jgi:steroid delta-isomerase-like uncharacterized protein